MCVKEFYGYNCGHCSVPVLRQCPLSSSNPHYPVCKYPAERPIFTNEFCHPCSRVVWNAKVLKEEDQHRVRHLRSECLCEVIFDGEDREKRLQTRDGRGKHKGTGTEVIRTEHQVGVADHVAFELKTSDGKRDRYAGDGGGIEKHNGMENNMALTKLEEDDARQSWEPEAQMAAYEYVGYYIDNGQNQGNDLERSYAVATGGRYDQGGQLPARHEGAGMKWYPEEQQYHQFPQLPQFPPLPKSATVFDNVLENAPTGPRASLRRASSLPVGHYDQPGAVARVEVPVVSTQPLLVSSDMMRS